MFWDCNHFTDNVGIQNIFARTRCQVVLQNNHFADNTKRAKTDKCCKIRIMDNLNQSFQAVFSNGPEQCIDEYMNSKYVSVSCPNIIKFYNNGIDGVDIMDQKTATYRLHRKETIAFT